MHGEMQINVDVAASFVFVVTSRPISERKQCRHAGMRLNGCLPLVALRSCLCIYVRGRHANTSAGNTRPLQSPRWSPRAGVRALLLESSAPAHAAGSEAVRRHFYFPLHAGENGEAQTIVLGLCNFLRARVVPRPCKKGRISVS